MVALPTGTESAHTELVEGEQDVLGEVVSDQ